MTATTTYKVYLTEEIPGYGVSSQTDYWLGCDVERNTQEATNAGLTVTVGGEVSTNALLALAENQGPEYF